MTRLRATITAPGAGLAAVTLLAVTFQAAGLAGRSDPGFPITSFFTGCLGVPFVTSGLLLAAILGALFRRPVAVAAGMASPLPLAAAYECIVDPTSHNLIPFEIIFLWMPAFVVALGAAFAGARLRGVPSSGEAPPAGGQPRR